MRAVVQRVTQAGVKIDGEVISEIGSGLLILLGIRKGDQQVQAELLAKKIAELRIFSDGVGKMNLSLLDVGGKALVVSQFTLYADLRRGRRPFFGEAEEPVLAARLCEHFCLKLGEYGATVLTGKFGAMMAVELCNDGPVTIILDSDELFNHPAVKSGPNQA